MRCRGLCDAAHARYGAGRSKGVASGKGRGRRAWKSMAAMLPRARTMMVTQLKKIALGIGSYESGLVMPSAKAFLSPSG